MIFGSTPPVADFDVEAMKEALLELKRMQHEAGITFIIVTHDQEEALVMADRMAILRDGRLLQVGAPELAQSDCGRGR